MKKIYVITKDDVIVESNNYEIENIGTHGVPFYSYKFKELGIDVEQTNVSEDFEDIKEKLNTMLDNRIKTVESKLKSLSEELEQLKSKIVA